MSEKLKLEREINKGKSLDLKTEKYRDKKKEKRKKDFEKLKKKYMEAKVVSKSVLKKNTMVVNIPDYKAPSVLNDPNRFFTGEFNKEKRSLFLS